PVTAPPHLHHSGVVRGARKPRGGGAYACGQISSCGGGGGPRVLARPLMTPGVRRETTRRAPRGSWVSPPHRLHETACFFLSGALARGPHRAQAPLRSCTQSESWWSSTPSGTSLPSRPISSPSCVSTRLTVAGRT